MNCLAPTPDLASEVRDFIRGLCDVVARYIERNEGAALLIVAIINRLCRRGDRLSAILARFKAGTLLAPRPDSAKRVHRTHAPRPADPVPRCRAYLVRLLQHEAAVYGRILAILLAEPEMAALLAASPQAGRLLRPLWRMLSPKPLPAILRPPPRPPGPPRREAERVASPPPPPTPPPAAPRPCVRDVAGWGGPPPGSG